MKQNKKHLHFFSVFSSYDISYFIENSIYIIEDKLIFNLIILVLLTYSLRPSVKVMVILNALLIVKIVLFFCGM